MSIPAFAKLKLGLRTFATDVAQGFFAISHNGLAVLGLSLFFFIVALSVRPDLRVITEAKVISWLQERQYDELGIETDADAVVFIDHDLSWEPEDLVRLIQHPGDVAAGDYRYKMDEETYMARLFTTDDGHPMVRADGTLRAHAVPAGFLKVTRAAVERFREAYPELLFGKDEFIDLFNHGAYEGLWWGEDFAFSRRWRAMGMVDGADQDYYRRDYPRRDWPGPKPLPARAVEGTTAENTACPYSGKPVTHVLELEGRRFGFCNAFCRDKTVADPEAWPSFMALYQS